MNSHNYFYFSIFLFVQCLSGTFLTETAKAAEAEAAIYDIDGNGSKDALTDGLLTIRYLFGFRGEVLTDRAVGPGATRNTPDKIEAYLLILSADLDIDGNGKTEALSDGLLLLRYLFGFTGDVLTDRAIGSGATRLSSEEIFAFIEGSCPTFFVNTPSAKRCTSYGMATYTFQGNETGTGTLSVQPYTGTNCSGTKSGAPINDTLTYTLENISIAKNCEATAKMTITTSYGSRTRNININNGVVSF